MTTISCALLWVLTPLLIVLVAIAWALETKRDRARRWKRQGLSQARIADRLGCSRWRVRQLLA
jgi:DNA-binding CsgD family transcriptional regulator